MQRCELLIMVPRETTQDQLKKLEKVVGHPIGIDYLSRREGNQDVVFNVPKADIDRIHAALGLVKFLKIVWLFSDEAMPEEPDGEEDEPIILGLDRYSRAAQACRSKTQLLAQLRKHRATLTKLSGKVDRKSWSAREARKYIAALKVVMQARGVEIPPGPEPDEKLNDLLRLFPDQ